MHRLLWALAALCASCSAAPAPPRFRVRSNCAFPIWVQHQYGAHGLPIPGNPNAKRLDRGEAQDYVIPAEGLAGSRFWAKTGCDETGFNCVMGDQVQNPSTGLCPPRGKAAIAIDAARKTGGCGG